MKTVDLEEISKKLNSVSIQKILNQEIFAFTKEPLSYVLNFLKNNKVESQVQLFKNISNLNIFRVLGEQRALTSLVFSKEGNPDGIEFSFYFKQGVKLEFEEVDLVEQKDFKIVDLSKNVTKYQIGAIFESAHPNCEMKNINIKLILKKPSLVLKHIVAQINTMEYAHADQYSLILGIATKNHERKVVGLECTEKQLSTMKSKLISSLDQIYPDLASAVKIKEFKAGALKNKLFLNLQNIWVVELEVDLVWVKDKVRKLLQIESMYYFKKNMETQLIPLTTLFQHFKNKKIQEELFQETLAMFDNKIESMENELQQLKKQKIQ